MKQYRRFLRGLVLGLFILAGACSLPRGQRETPAPAEAPETPTIVATPQRQVDPTSVNPAGPAGSADLIFTGADIVTMDDAQPVAQAIAIQGDRITAVGSNDEVLRAGGPQTLVVDLGGLTLVPGFIDSHQYRIQKYPLVGSPDAPSIIETAIEQGWTSLDELYADQPLLDELLSLDRAGSLRLRVNAYLPFMQYDETGTSLGAWYEAYKQNEVLSPHVRVGGLIGFADYDNARVMLLAQDALNAFLLKAQEEGWRLAIKTVSTRSLETILRAYEYVRSIDPAVVERRGQLEHALFITPDQIQRIKALGLIPVINLNNPGQLVGEADVETLIGQEPQGSYTPWRSLVEAGITFSNASGWPSYYVVEPSGAPFGSPIHLIYQAVTRVGNLGKQPPASLLDQAISADDAMRALTINGAYTTFEEGSKGSLTPGKLADMVVLSDNPLKVAAEQINAIQVLMTMIGGKVEFCAAGKQAICPSAAASPLSPLPSASSAGAAAPFTGTWIGTDPDDASTVTVTLTQQGEQLSGTFADTYSTNVPPPGFQGNGTGAVLSPTQARMTFDLSRWDGKSVSLGFTLNLRDDYNTLDMTVDGGSTMVLKRQ